MSIERSEEIAALVSCVGASRTDGAILVLVEGGPGLGKSSLLRAVDGPLRQLGATVLSAVGDEHASTFGTLSTLFAPLGGFRTAAPVSPSTWQLPTDSYAMMTELFALVVDLMAAGPLVLLLDDAPTCDAATLRWLDFLLRRSSGLPLTVVLTQRPGTASAGGTLIAELSAAHRTVTLDLAPLTASDVAAAMERTAGTPPCPSLVRLCAEISGGNPALVGQLIERWRADGVQLDNADVPRATALAREVLTDWVRDRMVGYPDQVRRVATALAVLEVDDGAAPCATALRTLCGMSEMFVSAALDALRRDGLLATSGARFRHREVRAAVLEGVPTQRLDSLRREAVSLLEDAGLAPRELAPLLMALTTPPIPSDCRILVEAAATAAEHGAPETAVAYLERVLSATPEDVDVVLQLADVLAKHDPAAAVVQLTTAVEHLSSAVDRSPNLRRRAVLASRLGTIALAAGQGPRTFSLLCNTFAEFNAQVAAEPSDDDIELLHGLRSVVVAVGLNGESTTAEILARTRTPTPHGNSLDARAVDGWSAYTLMLAGYDARLVAERARTGLVQGPESYYRPMIASALALRYAGEEAAALAALGRIVTSGFSADLAGSRPMVHAARACVLEGMGELTEAATEATAALNESGRGEIGPDRGIEDAAAPEIRLASILVKTGDPRRALALLNRAPWPQFGWTYPVAAMTRAEALRLLGDQDRALTILRRCGRQLVRAGIRNPVFAPWWLEAACLLVGMGRRSEAVELAEYGEDTVRDWETAESAGLGLLVRGVVTTGADGLDYLDAAVHTLAETPARLSHARAEYLYGRALLDQDKTDAARAHLRRAVELAVRCDYLSLGTVARDLLVLAGGRMEKLSGRRADTLSGTESRIAALAAAGATNRMIAEALFISVRTVETHLSHVYRKLGTRLRTELATALGPADVAVEGG